jgi:poly(3-hydroxybutyrate) depolymerase
VLSIWHGGADVVVSPGNAARIAGQWAAAHGLSARPDETQMLFGRTRSVWRNADGEPVMDLTLLPAMGHGWPLATTGPEGLGTAAHFMLETGVPSTLEIARFWKIAPEASAPEASAQDAPSAHPIGDRVMAEIAKHVPGGVQDTLARAMRAAGLLS